MDKSANLYQYLPISNDLLHSGFFVTSAGRSTVGPEAPYPTEAHPSLYHFSWESGRVLPEFQLLLITDGAGVFETRAKPPVTLNAGMAVLLVPGMWHRYRPDRATGWTEKWVQFNGVFAHRLFDLGVVSAERRVIRPADFPPVNAAMDRLLANVRENPAFNSLSYSLQTLGIVAAVAGGAPFPPETMPLRSREYSDPVTVAAIEYIWTRSHHVLSVSDVAAAAGVTRRTLERRMAAAFGHSVLAEIVRCRFSRAERLLRETDLPVKNIVALAGFGSLENMRQVFIARTALSPAAYRNRQRAHLFALNVSGI